MKYIFLLITSVIIILTGCQSEQATPQKQEIVKNQEKKKTKQIPLWIDNPNLNGYVGAVGVVKKMSNTKKQKYIARTIAIADLQEKKRVLVESQMIITKTANNKTMSSSSMQVMKQSSSHYKSDKIIVKDEYVDNENYYVWMVIHK